MFRLLRILFAITLAGVALSVVAAQNGNLPQAGDPPVASLIGVSLPDADGLVTVSGVVGAVFPGAQVAIRNLYTGDTAYVQAGLNGSFSATLYGPGNTPFWVSPATNIPNAQRSRPGSLPGGPGTIVYGPFPQTPQVTTPVTQLVLDGALNDWEDRYPNAQLASRDPVIYALVNQDSLYLSYASPTLPADYSLLEVSFTIDGVVYALLLDPRQNAVAGLTRLQPNPRELGTLAASGAQADAIELRVPLVAVNPGNPTVETSTLESLRFLAADGAELLAVPVQQPITLAAESDGIVRLTSLLEQDFTRFTVSGTLAGGSNRWAARGRINRQAFNPSDQLVLELDVTMDAPDLPEGLVGLQMIGHLGLLPIIGPDGRQADGGLESNNGWTDVLTPSGLGITNLRGDFLLGEVIVPPQRVIRRAGQLLFSLDFVLTLPDDLPAGLYAPFIQGYGQVSDGERFRWEASSPLGSGSSPDRGMPTRLPLVFTVDGVTSGRLLWTLFQDSPSDGSRGLLSDEDRGHYALSNRVHENSATYILPPRRGPSGEPLAYPLEPYLLNLMPNTYDSLTVPLIPFLFPGGRLNARVTRPDGQVNELGSSAIIQSLLSTAAADERTVFGAQSQVDVYRLTTLNKSFSAYVFDQYGDYTISLTGNLEDVWGNRYEGGGTYHVLIAELLDILPAALPGTPFETGDTFNPGLHVSPGVPADVTVTLRLFPLNGDDAVEFVAAGQANTAGYFYSPGFPLDVSAEYVVDYEVRYTDAEGRLWAGSLRGAGVVAGQSGLIAHGRRGIDGEPARQAWYIQQQYAPDADPARLNYPYHSGDVLWAVDGRGGQINPVIQVQDTGGQYTAWLTQNLAPDFTRGDQPLGRMAVEAELPVALFSFPGTLYGPSLAPEGVAYEAYTYVSAVQPGLTSRQFVQGGLDGGLLTHWDMDDPYNGQAGAGLDGMRPGDYAFLFGGAVIRNAESGLADAAIYGAFASVIDPNDSRGPRVFPPYRGEAGGPNGGPLLTVRGEEIDMFFHPTGVRPGDVLAQGDTIAVAGHIAPALASVVSVTITSPSGVPRQFTGVANAVGYFYDPAQDFAADEPGVWTVAVQVRHDGLTSAGMVEPPPPTGGVLGTDGGRFQVYVLPDNGNGGPLDWNDTRTDIAIPPGIPYNFNFPLPDDWNDIQVFHTLSTPGYVLAQGPLRPSGRSFSFQYNPTNLSRDFPNLENNGQGVGAASSDVVTLTFVAFGTDGNGRFVMRGRSYTIAHDRMMTFG